MCLCFIVCVLLSLQGAARSSMLIRLTHEPIIFCTQAMRILLEGRPIVCPHYSTFLLLDAFRAWVCSASPPCFLLSCPIWVPPYHFVSFIILSSRSDFFLAVHSFLLPRFSCLLHLGQLPWAALSRHPQNGLAKVKCHQGGRQSACSHASTAQTKAPGHPPASTKPQISVHY
jgi:hypothetical protein